MIVEIQAKMVKSEIDQTGASDFSIEKIADAIVMALGIGITLIGITLLVTLFNGVYHIVFDNTDGLETIFQGWRKLVVPEGIELGHYDQFFPTTTAMAFIAMAFPVFFLAWLAGKILTLGVRVASLRR